MTTTTPAKPNGRKALLESKTGGYRPVSASGASWAGLSMSSNRYGIFGLMDVDEMRKDSQVSMALNFRAAPLYTAEIEVECQDAEVKDFADKTRQRFWANSLSAALESYAFGYAGCEPIYTEDEEKKNVHGDPVMHFDTLKSFLWRDVRPLTWKGKLAGVRVRNINREPGTEQEGHLGYVDLEAARKDFPAKGVWFVHNGRYNPWYGRPLTVPMWYPWRLKYMPDGIIDDIAKFAYKFAISCTVIRHPNEIYEDEGGVERHAADLARETVELVKAGGVVALSSDTDEQGKYKWAIDQWAKVEGTADGLIGIADFYDKCIRLGAEIPDEVIDHQGNTGGYSRSQISASSFLIICEQSLNHVLATFDDQICRPLTVLNYGAKRAKYRFQPKPLVLPDQQPGQGQPGAEQGQGPQPGQQPGGGLEKMLAGAGGGQAGPQQGKPKALQFSAWVPHQPVVLNPKMLALAHRVVRRIRKVG